MNAIVEMKELVISEFLEYLNKLNRSNNCDDVYDMKAKILFIESNSQLDKFHFIYEKLI